MLILQISIYYNCSSYRYFKYWGHLKKTKTTTCLLGQNPSRPIGKWKGFGWEKIGMKIFTINSLLTRVHCERSHFWKAARPGNLWISGSTRTAQHLVAALSLSHPERSSYPWTKLPFKGLDSPEATPTSWDWIIPSKGSGKTDKFTEKGVKMADWVFGI